MKFKHLYLGKLREYKLVPGMPVWQGLQILALNQALHPDRIVRRTVIQLEVGHMEPEEQVATIQRWRKALKGIGVRRGTTAAPA